MDFRILGALEVVSEGHPLPLGGGKQRALLALLLLHPNEAVSVDRLVDDLWGERPPPTAAKNVQVYVSHLRKALGDDVIVTTPPGYAVRVAEGELDADRAAQALAAAAGRPAPERRELLAAALAEWRGSPLAELADVPSAQGEIGRLEELRLQLLSAGSRPTSSSAGMRRSWSSSSGSSRHTRSTSGSGRSSCSPSTVRVGRRTRSRSTGTRGGRSRGSSGSSRTRSCAPSSSGSSPTIRALQAPPPPPLAVAAPAAGTSGRTPTADCRGRSLLGAGLIVAAAAAVAVLALARDESPAALDVPRELDRRRRCRRGGHRRRDPSRTGA